MVHFISYRYLSRDLPLAFHQRQRQTLEDHVPFYRRTLLEYRDQRASDCSHLWAWSAVLLGAEYCGLFYRCSGYSTRHRYSIHFQFNYISSFMNIKRNVFIFYFFILMNTFEYKRMYKISFFSLKRIVYHKYCRCLTKLTT